MITIKLPYKSDYKIIDLMCQYTILVKSCYNRLLKGYSDKEIHLYLKSLNNINDLDSRFIEMLSLIVKPFKKKIK